MNRKHTPKKIIQIGLRTVLPASTEIHYLSLWKMSKFPKIRYGLFGVTVWVDNRKIFVPYGNIAYIRWIVE